MPMPGRPAHIYGGRARRTDPTTPWSPGLTATTRLSAAHTGSISIAEHVFSLGVLVPPHRHTPEDEIS
jgi:hypothetical protein